jgi:hypothetical protein
MSAIDQKYAALGGASGFLGASKSAETTCPDGVGHFRHYAFGSIYWHPDVGAFEVHGTIRSRWAKLGWERSFLGYPITDETKTPDTIGRFNHFQNGSIYWKPTISAHEVHGLIRHYWAQHGWEKYAALGYPISDELPTKAEDPDRYSDFENGVLFWKSGSANAVELWPFDLANASKSPSEMLQAISAIIVPVITKPVDGHKVYLTSGPSLGGPEPLGTNLNVSLSTTDYRFDGSNVRNRWYKVRTGLAIEVEGSADISITLDLQIEVFLDKAKHKVFAAPRKWWAHVHVPWPTSWGISADEVYAKLKPPIVAEMDKLHEVASVPEAFNFLSLKVLPDGALNFYTEPLG